MALACDIPAVIHTDGIIEVTEDLDLEHTKSGRRTLIRKGFRTDLASVPRFLSWLTPIAGVHNVAAIRHDRNCVEQAEAYRDGRAPDITSVETDGMFLDDLLELGVPLYRARAYWVGVRFGAAKNKARRADWGDTFPEVLLWTLLLLPVLPAGLLVWVTLFLGGLLNRIIAGKKQLTERHEFIHEVFAARREP